jgi:hypothetical protein
MKKTLTATIQASSVVNAAARLVIDSNMLGA